MVEPTGVLLTVHLGSSNGDHSFASYEDVENWLKIEHDAWEWVKGVSLPGNLVGTIYSNLARPWVGVQQYLPPARQQTAVPNKYYSRIKSAIESSYADGRSIHSGHRDVQLLTQLRTEDPRIAIGALAFFTSRPISEFPADEQARPLFEGYVRALLYRLGVQANSAEMEALQRLEKDYRARLMILEGQSKENSTALETFTRATHAQQDRHDLELRAHREESKKQYLGELAADRSELATTLDTAKKDIQRITTSAVDELGKIKKTYQEFMTLEAPVAYWDGQRDFHAQALDKIKPWLIGVATVVVLVLCGVWLLSATLVDDWSKQYLVPVGLMFVLTSAGLWALRVLVRLFLSHKHLSTVAAERVAMSKTYLALVKDGKIDNAEDRKLALRPLFTLAATGIVRDDAAPPHWSEFLSRPQ